MSQQLIRYRAWDTAGDWAWWVGSAITRGPVYRFGLWLCGMAGDCHGRADAAALTGKDPS
jgi:hypothetical protein